MDNLLNMLPKGLIAFLAIAGGGALIILLQPPATVCQSQLEVLREAQRTFLFVDEKYPDSRVIKSTKFEYLRDRCKMTNQAGGCYELFQEMKVLLHDLQTVPEDCGSSAGGIKEIRRAMWESMDLLVKLAWGEKPPTAYHAKFGWLDTADVSLYCRLKEGIERIYGDDEWSRFREKQMKELPGAAELPRNQVWDMSLFSENCARYP